MKRLLLLALVFCTLASPAFGWGFNRDNKPLSAPHKIESRQKSRHSGAIQKVLARVTVYWARGGRGSDHWTRRHQTSTGTRLHEGHCAVDPRRVRYGSQVKLPTGEVLTAVDTGGAVKNRYAARRSGHTAVERSAIVIDRFFEQRSAAIAWANTHPAFMLVAVLD